MKQKEGIEGLRNVIKSNCDNKQRLSDELTPIFAGAAISGLFAIFYDTDDQD